MYKIHKLYIISHILTGVISYFYPVLWIGILTYQLSQLCMNKRFFLCNRQNCIRDGNSIKHTLYKLSQYLLGYLLIEIITIFKN